MKLCLLLAINFGCLSCKSILNQTVEVPQDNETYMPIEIVVNYVHKYISHKKMFLSITSHASNDEQKYLQEILVANFLKHPRIEQVSYNRLTSKIHQLRRGNTNVFNFIFVDGSDSLT